MKKCACLLLALLFCVTAFAGCRKGGGQSPTTASDPTSSPVASESTESTEAPTTPTAPSTAAGEYFYDNGGSQFYIRLPESMSVDYSVINDMEFAGWPDHPELPHKVGEFWGVRALAPGETVEDLGRALLQRDAQAEESWGWEALDAGNFTGERGNKIHYQVVVSSIEFEAYMYVFHITLDKASAVQMYFWNSVYTPAVDLPRFKEIVASVRP